MSLENLSHTYSSPSLPHTRLTLVSFAFVVTATFPHSTTAFRNKLKSPSRTSYFSFSRHLRISLLCPFQIPKLFLRSRHRVRLSQRSPVARVVQLIFLLRFTQLASIFPNDIPHTFAFVQLLVAVSSQENVDRALSCIVLRLKADDAHSHTANPLLISTLSHSDILFPLLGLVLSSFIFGLVHVLHQSHPAALLAPRLYWRLHRFDLSHFCCG